MSSVLQVKAQKNLSPFAIIMMNVGIVGSLQMMTACAMYGYSVLFYYFIAILAFFIPCILLISELSSAQPATGGSYIWVEKAFGKKWAFFVVCIQWLANLIWYPTIFSLIATLLAYLIDPKLASSKLFIMGSSVLFFWIITMLNSFGIRVSSIVSTVSSLIGVILPTLILIFFGIYWSGSGMKSQIAFSWKEIIPEFGDLSRWAFLTQVIASLIGIEMSAVHAGDIRDAKRTIPRAFIYSTLLILIIVIAAPLAINLVIPSNQISIIAGLIDALKIFFESFRVPSIIFLGMIALVFIGNIGSVTAWMISSTRAMHVASVQCKLPPFFQKTNNHKAPLGVLLLEAIIFTLICALFCISSISNSYWLLLVLASQLALIYYIPIFAAAIKLKKQYLKEVHGYKIPFGVKGTAIAALFGCIASLLTVFFGFFPPDSGTLHEGTSYSFVLALGLIVSLTFPLLLLKYSKLRYRMVNSLAK